MSLEQHEKVVGMVETNAYIAADSETRQAVIIDPGDDAEGLLKIIRQNSYKLTYIFLTHGHFDHILAVEKIRKDTDALVVIHDADAECLTQPERSLMRRFTEKSNIGRADILAQDKTAFQVGGLLFKWIHTPGHTPGSCCIECGDRLYTGDTMFKGDYGRTDLPGGDHALMIESLRKLFGLEGNYRVFPGHGESTTLDDERKNN